MEKNMFKKMREEARQDIINHLEEGYNGYLCDFHSEVFNSDYKYIYDFDAIHALNEDGVFEAIGVIVDYEKYNFEEVYTDLTNPCKVANMLYYIISEEELIDMFEGCDDFNEFWNEELTEEKCKMLLAWLKDNDRI